QIDPAHSKRAHAAHRFGELVRTHFDRQISPVKAARSECRLLHHSGWIFRYWFTENSYQFRFITVSHLMHLTIEGMVTMNLLRILALLAFPVLASAQAINIDIPYEKFVLPNGLTVIVHEDHKAPIVCVNVWYHVGSKNEKFGKTGFAHLFE